MATGSLYHLATFDFQTPKIIVLGDFHVYAFDAAPRRVHLSIIQQLIRSCRLATPHEKCRNEQVYSHSDRVIVCYGLVPCRATSDVIKSRSILGEV